MTLSTEDKVMLTLSPWVSASMHDKCCKEYLKACDDFLTYVEEKIIKPNQEEADSFLLGQKEVNVGSPSEG